LDEGILTMPTQVDRWLRIREVFHPTDCSQGSKVALLHALRISLAAEARLTLMRVSPDGNASAEDFPDVRGLVANWPAQRANGEPVPELRLRWHATCGDDPVRSCLKSLDRSPAELIVVATHQQDGKMTWLETSVAGPLARSSGTTTLLVPEGIAGFVRPEDGAITLKSILVPVASQPRPEPAIEAARRLMLYLPEAQGAATVLYVGEPSGMPAIPLPDVPGWKWNRIVQSGDVIETILKTAVEVSADLVAMTTEGRHGFLDALRGSTTERVLRQANCPLLTMPVGSFLG
jgi:nucleotide-binding universal stress UspA family protein